jgi:hypothetical protein
MVSRMVLQVIVPAVPVGLGCPMGLWPTVSAVALG